MEYQKKKTSILSNDEGNLGLNNRTSYSSPVQIPGTDWYSMANIGGGGQGAFGVKEL